MRHNASLVLMAAAAVAIVANLIGLAWLEATIDNPRWRAFELKPGADLVAFEQSVDRGAREEFGLYMDLRQVAGGASITVTDAGLLSTPARSSLRRGLLLGLARAESIDVHPAGVSLEQMELALPSAMIIRVGSQEGIGPYVVAVDKDPDSVVIFRSSDSQRLIALDAGLLR